MDKPRFFRFLAFLLSSLTAVSLLAGCGTAPKPAGSTVVVGITQEPGTFDPFLAKAAGDKEILFNIFEGLVKCDAKGVMQPALAESYEISADAKTYTFKLRQGVVFHNEKPVTAEDAVYSLERASDQAGGGKNALPGLSGIRSVKSPDAKTLVLTLAEPDVELLPFLTCAVVPRDSTDLNTKPIGTGPFRFDSYSTGQRVVLVKNPTYWKSGQPLLDRVEFRIAADMDAAFLELKAGNIDIFPYLSFERAGEIANLYETRADLKNMVQLLALNNRRAPFSDKRVREAVNLAVDRQGLLDQLNAGYGTPLVTGMSPAMGRFYNDKLAGRFDLNLAKARSLLAEAGFPSGFEMTITVPSNYIFHVNTAIILAEQLKAVGIRASIVQVDWPTWLEKVYTGREFDSTIIALTSEYTPKDVLSRYVSDNPGNFINYSNPEYDRIFKQTLPLTDETARIAGYKSLQEILVNDSASVYLQDPATMVAIRKNIKGYETYPIYVQDLATVYRSN